LTVMWLLINLILQGCLMTLTSSERLLTLLPGNGQRSARKPCLQPDVEDCAQALVNMTLLQTADSITIPGVENEEIVLSLSSRSDNSAVFVSGLDKVAYFTWRGTTLSGQVQAGSHSWSLEGCGIDCYSWVKQDRTSWKEETCEKAPDSELITPKRNINFLKSLGVKDTETIVTYSVMMWYTQEFRNLFSSEEDLDTFTDLIIFETNDAYIKGNMPVRIQKHCAKKHPTMNEDQTSSSTVLSKFKNSMSTSELRNSADSAALLVADLSGCGIAYTHVTGSCFTLSVTKKSCATGYYSFGHEIGHNYGAKHNAEQYSTSELNGHPYLHGHGYLIQPTGPTEWSGYRTILAYRAYGHYQRINRYSDPDQQCADCLEDGVALGDEKANNAKVITDNRFVMAACGAEDSVCSAPTETTTTAPSCNVKYIKNKTIVGKKIKMKKLKTNTAQVCWSKCSDNPKCKAISWVAKSKNKKLRKSCSFYQQAKKLKKKKGITSGKCM